MSSQNSNLKIGEIFTPLKWGEFAIKEFGIFERWMNGCTIFDPTMGSAYLLQALVEHGLTKGYVISDLPLKNLYGNELNQSYYFKALSLFKERYFVDMSQNFFHSDILDLKSIKYDILFGNPPWCNFVDLPVLYKNSIKKDFFTYGLIKNSKFLLLGGSRIDLAALVVQKSIQDFLVNSGVAIFFLPLSLFLNDGAHTVFRNYKVLDIDFSLQTIYDFKGITIFENVVSTRYGLVLFQKNKVNKYPISYKKWKDNRWVCYHAEPLLGLTSPLSVREKNESFGRDFKLFVISKSSKARQGINTCGANYIFFFNSYRSIDNNLCEVNGESILPKKFVHSLLVSKNFGEKSMCVFRWVLLPYDQEGKPLLLANLKKYPLLYTYLHKHELHLKNRKGVMLSSYIKRGVWWAMLGVGKYNFVKYKVVWESYGKKRFLPMIVLGNWQVNQSLQSYVPCMTMGEARKILHHLESPFIEKHLLSLEMEGTMNWAQPGKINKFFKLV